MEPATKRRLLIAAGVVVLLAAVATLAGVLGKAAVDNRRLRRARAEQPVAPAPATAAGGGPAALTAAPVPDTADAAEQPDPKAPFYPESQSPTESLFMASCLPGWWCLSRAAGCWAGTYMPPRIPQCNLLQTRSSWSAPACGQLCKRRQLSGGPFNLPLERAPSLSPLYHTPCRCWAQMPCWWPPRAATCRCPTPPPAPAAPCGPWAT